MRALALQQKSVANAAPKAAPQLRAVAREEVPENDGRSMARGGTNLAAPPPRSGNHPSSFGHSIALLPALSSAPLSIQPKLKINQPGDKYEQEADRVADMVMRMPAPQNALASNGARAKVDQGPLQMKRVDPSSAGRYEVPSEVHQVLKEAGRPLDVSTRAFMELRFGHDLSTVRIHDDAGAASSAANMNARAYTVGSQIVFGAGQFAPTHHQGRALLAHELTHTVQQGAQPGAPMLQRSEDEAASATSREVIDVEGAIAGIEGWQMDLSGAVADSNIVVKVGAFVPFLLADLLKRAVQLGNALFGVTQLQQVADVLVDPGRSAWQKTKAALWGAVVVALSALMIGGVAEKLGLQLAAWAGRLTKAAWFVAVKQALTGMLIDALVLAEKYLPTFLSLIDGASSWVIAGARRLVNWVASSDWFRNALAIGAQKIPLPRAVEVLSEDVIGIVRQKLGGEAGSVLASATRGGSAAVEATGTTSESGLGLFGKAPQPPSGPISNELRQMYLQEFNSKWFRFKLDALARIKGATVDWKALTKLVESAEFREYASVAEAAGSVGYAGIVDQKLVVGMAGPMRRIPILGRSSMQHELVHIFQELTGKMLSEEAMMRGSVRGYMKIVGAEIEANVVGSPALFITYLGFTVVIKQGVFYVYKQ